MKRRIVSIHGLLRALTRGSFLGVQNIKVSIHGLLRALTVIEGTVIFIRSFNPRALTSPDSGAVCFSIRVISFNPRALTSPDPYRFTGQSNPICFNPRALTSPDVLPQPISPAVWRFNPRALTSPDMEAEGWKTGVSVSIHGLLRALTDCVKDLSSDPVFQSTGSYEP